MTDLTAHQSPVAFALQVTDEQDAAELAFELDGLSQRPESGNAADALLRAILFSEVMDAVAERRQSAGLKPTTYACLWTIQVTAGSMMHRIAQWPEVAELADQVGMAQYVLQTMVTLGKTAVRQIHLVAGIAPDVVPIVLDHLAELELVECYESNVPRCNITRLGRLVAKARSIMESAGARP